MPISFLFELKSEGPGLDKRIKHVDAAGLDQLDGVLQSGFADGQIITPDMVARRIANASRCRHRPRLANLEASRGKVLFILHDDGQQRDLYTEQHPSLRGRLMFVRSDERRDDGATLVLDDADDPNIPRLAKLGFYIRTRADSGLRVAPPSQPARRDAAFASGADIISTDYPPGQPDTATGYVVEFENQAPARFSPVQLPRVATREAVCRVVHTIDYTSGLALLPFLAPIR